MSEISASIGHELNQPLGAIRNNVAAAEILLKADPPNLKEVTEILRDISRDDRRASDIVARIGRMLRKTAVEVRSTDLNEIISETGEMLAPEASERGVSLNYDLEPGLPPVRADHVQLQQVVTNLVLNAIHAMQDKPAGQRELMLQTRRAGRNEVEVSVADSGVGIPADLLPRIFDAFVSSSETGLGLGLAISRTIIEAHGGNIRAENRAGGGAIILVTLPLAAGSAG